MLALVANRELLAKADIDALRGPDSAATVRQLVRLRVVAVTRRAEAGGLKVGYGATPRFLKRSGLTSLDDLARLADANRGQLMREPLLTDRLILRDVTEADAELLFGLDSDPEVLRYIGPRPAPDVGGYRERTRTVHVPYQAHPWHGLRIVLDRASGEFLGWVFARPATDSKFAREIGWTRADEVEIGYRYRRSAWGRGLATEAAAPLVQIALADPATTAMVACALAGNAGSLRVVEKLGLERVGEVTLSETDGPTVKLARVK